MSRTQLPVGCALISLTMHRDDRGVFTELYRAEWNTGIAPIQWNAVASNAGVLRGVHVHLRHADYLIVVKGRATIGYRDLRPDSPTYGMAGVVEMTADAQAAMVTPPGVAHGFYFHEPSMHVYSVSHYWDMADELGCRWDDPALEIPWPQKSAHISSRDEQLQPFAALQASLPRTWLTPDPRQLPPARRPVHATD